MWLRLVVVTAMVLSLAACEVDFEASAGGSGQIDPEVLGEQISDGLSEQLGGVFTVECPSGQPNEVGTTFECRATDESGQVGIITVVISDDAGNVDWELAEVLPSAGHEDQVSVSPAVRPEGVPADWVLFAEPGVGYLLWHPRDWAVDRSPTVTVFSGPEGTDAYRTTVNVQVLLTSAVGGTYADADALYDDLVEQIADMGGDIFWEEEDDLMLVSGPRRARGFQAYWQMEGEEFMQMALVMARDADSVVQISYTAPVELYEDFLDLAITIIESFDVVDT
ncbi:MAG: DUF4333 domain-containing protein [Nitriliruptoraceae bacterium]